MSKSYRFENEEPLGPRRRLTEKEAAGDYALHWPLVLDSRDDSVPALLEFKFQARLILHNNALRIRALESDNEQLKAEKADLAERLAKCESEKTI